MKAAKRISLIVPVHNAARFLPALTASIQAQDWENLQLIFSDDGSTDESLTVLRQLQQQNAGIVVVTGENTGVSSARNRALRLADGDYIGFSDADDVLAPGYFHTLAALLEQYQADVACCGFDRIYEAAGTADCMPPKHITQTVATDRTGYLSYLLRPDGYTTVVWNKLFRREALTRPDGSLQNFDEDLHIVEDGVYLLRAKVHRAVFTPQPLYQYTVRSTGAMYGAINARKLTELPARRRIVELTASEAPEVHALARMKYQKGVRDLLFHAVISGVGSSPEIRRLLPELRVYRRELFQSPALSRKEKLKYRVYGPMIRLNLRRTGAFLMKHLSGH